MDAQLATADPMPAGGPFGDEGAVADVPRPLVFIAWGAVAGRSSEIATALGGEAHCFFPPGTGWRPPVLSRWVLSACRTVTLLVRRRPAVVIITNPPAPAGVVAWLCARLLGAVLVLDSHPGGFGVQGDRVAARLQALHRFVARRAAVVLVTDERWARVVEGWGGRAVVVHEAPGDWDTPAPQRHDRLHVLVAGRLAADEPVAEVLEAARALPAVDFTLTGDPRHLDPSLVASAPDNATFAGFLDPIAYRAAVQDADAVAAFTTEPTSVMRAAYEAVYARRPLVTSDWPLSRALFPDALHAAHSGEAIAAAVGSLDADFPSRAARVEPARTRQSARWRAQRDALVAVLRDASG